MPDVSNTAFSLPVRAKRGRPSKDVLRPACPSGHAGHVVLDGTYKLGKKYGSRRFRCLPANGAKHHGFTWPHRMRWPVRPYLDEPAHCAHCEQAFREGFGPRIGRRCRYTYHEIAAMLVLVGKGISFRRASYEARRSADQWHQKAGMMRSDEAKLTGLYTSLFGPIIAEELSVKEWPTVVAVDSLPIKRKTLGQDGKPRQAGQDAGEIAVAVEHWTDPVSDREMSQPIYMKLMGNKDRVSWAQFFSGLQGRPDIIVLDGDSGADAAISDLKWEEQGTLVFRCEAHFVLNAEKAAFADGMLEFERTGAFDPKDELVEMRRLLMPRKGRPKGWERAELFMSIRHCMESQASWKALKQAVRKSVPADKHELRKWIKGAEPLIMDQFQLKADGYPGPRSVGAVERVNIKLKAYLANRGPRFGNRRRFDAMLALITLDLSGKADPDAYRRIVGDHFAAHHMSPGADWANLLDGQVSTMDRLIVEASLGQAKAAGLVEDAARAKRLAAVDKLKVDHGLRQRKAREDGGQRRYPTEGLYLTDIEMLRVQWHPTENGDLDPSKIPANSPQLVVWQCEREAEHVWPRPVVRRASTRSRCPFHYGTMVAADNSLRATFPEIADEWHPSKNQEYTPDNTRPQSGRKIWWTCPDGHDPYLRVVEHRTIRGWGCQHTDHKRKPKTKSTAAQRGGDARRQRRVRGMRRAGDDMLAGNVEASGKWQRVLTEEQMREAREQLRGLRERLGGARAVGRFLARSPASVEAYRVRSNVPLVIAGRIEHLVAIADAVGSHADLHGWLESQNPMLDGKRPGDLLIGEWKSTDAGPAMVLRAARAFRSNRSAA